MYRVRKSIQGPCLEFTKERLHRRPELFNRIQTVSYPHLDVYKRQAKDGGVGDLVAIQVQDGQNSAVTHGVQELVGLPAGGQGARCV